VGRRGQGATIDTVALTGKLFQAGTGQITP
jgi:hypothetical protein